MIDIIFVTLRSEVDTSHKGSGQEDLLESHMLPRCHQIHRGLEDYQKE